MHFLNGKLMLSEGWKCYFRDPIFQNLPGEHAPGPPLAARALGTRNWPPINLTFLRHCSFWYPAESQGYMWAFLIHWFLTHLSIGPVLKWRLRPRKTITEGRWQRAFTAVKEQFEHESLLPEHKNTLRKFLQGQNAFVNYPTGFPLPSNRCRCTAHYGQF